MNFRIKYELSFLLMFLMLQKAFCQLDRNKCEYKDANGNVFDLKSLEKSDYWKVRDIYSDSSMFAVVYLFNFCKNVAKETCHGQSAASLEILEVFGQHTDNCEINGKSDFDVISPIDQHHSSKGLMIKFTHGDICTTSDIAHDIHQPKKTTFIINCATTQESNFVQSKFNSYDISKCNLRFEINSPAGCPINSGGLFSSTKLLFFFCLFICCYFLIGYYVKLKYYGFQGRDAIPNIEFWLESPYICYEGFQLFSELSRSFASKCMSKFNQSKHSSAYSMV